MIALPETSQPLRYALVGAVCAVAHNLIVIGLDLWRVHYAAASVISYIVVVLLGFALHTRFTFAVTPGLRSFARYAVAMAANYPLTIGLLFVMVDVAHAPVSVAAPVATVVLVGWNYIASRWAILTAARLQTQPPPTGTGAEPR